MRNKEKSVGRERPGIAIVSSLMRMRLPGRSIMTVICLSLCSVLLAGSGQAVISDRVVAFVDDQAITMSELDEQFRDTVKITPEITKGEVLDTMINRLLLLREARKYRIEAPSTDQVMHEYIDLKIRAFIRVGEAEIENFYLENKEDFGGREFNEARDEIDAYLTEKKLNERLKELIMQLRADAYIKTFLEKEH
jgi:hypothetical protein